MCNCKVQVTLYASSNLYVDTLFAVRVEKGDGEDEKEEKRDEEDKLKVSGGKK